MAMLRMTANYMLPPCSEARLALRAHAGLAEQTAFSATPRKPHEGTCNVFSTLNVIRPSEKLLFDCQVGSRRTRPNRIGASCSAARDPGCCTHSSADSSCRETLMAGMEDKLHKSSGILDGLQQRSKEEAATVFGADDEVQLKSGPLQLQSFFLLNIGLLPLQSFEPNSLSQDLSLMALGVLGAFTWVRIIDELARQNLLDQKLSRKLVHISTGLLYMFLWPFFSAAPAARLFAALVPFLNISKLLLLGLGIVKDEAAVRSISREGKPEELLRGPLYYVLAFTFLILCFWRTSPTGVVALSLMCGGDGIADIVGRRFGSAKLPWNPNKSWAGSIAMMAFGFPLSLAFTYFFCNLGFYECEFWSTATRVAIITLAATLAESVPFEQLDDNLTVPFTAAVVGSILFPSSLSWLTS